MIASRRHFVRLLGALALASAGRSSALAAAGTPPLGLNTWSLRALNHDEAVPAILQIMQQAGIKQCQLLFSHAEPAAFDPDFGSMMKAGAAPATVRQIEEKKRRQQARAAWFHAVPMSYFEQIREQFHNRGLMIRAYSTPLAATAEEIDRSFLMAKSLGATQLNTRLAESQTDLAAAAATRHGLLVGIQVVDPQLLAQQLRVSRRMTADPDIGDLTKAGIPALAFIQENLDQISSIDLKDAIRGGASVPFGTGESRMGQVLEVLKSRPSRCTPYIDCDYPGTGRSTEEIAKCVAYARGVLDS